MRALVFLLKLLLKIVMVPVILALTLFVWICVGIVYVSGLVLGLISMVIALLGVAVLQLAEFLLLVFADSVLTCLRLFLCREFHNVVHNHLAVHRFAHLYLVFLIVVDGLPEYLSVRETVATAFLHIVQNVGHALVHVLGRVAVLLCK